MAKNFIKIDRSTSTAIYAQDLLAAITQLRSTLNQFTKVKGIMDTNWATTNFVDVEALFGVPTGQGSAVYALVRDSLLALQTTAPITIIDKVG